MKIIKTTSKHRSRHHHSLRGKCRRSWKKIKKFMKQNPKRVATVATGVALVIVLVIVGVIVDGRITAPTPTPSASVTPAPEKEMLQLEIPLFTDEVSLVLPTITAYLNHEMTLSDTQAEREMGRLDVGLPVNLSYKLDGLPDGVRVSEAKTEIAEKQDFSDARVYSFAKGKNSVAISYLKVNTQYYYRIRLILSDGRETGGFGSFMTADTPRILSVDGIVNVRDIGGWKTLDGKRIKQGMLYRGSEMDGAVESGYKLTEQGQSTMLTELGIRMDMDLRAATDHVDGIDPLGANVAHQYYDAPMYEGIFTDAGKASVRRIFADLADKSNYPIYLHCTYGLDRTGTVSYLLGALLGMSEEDLMKEYKLSGMYHGTVKSTELKMMVDELKVLSGATLQQKTEGYLLSIGVTRHEILSIREIFLG